MNKPDLPQANEVKIYGEKSLLFSAKKVISAHQPGFWHPGIWAKTFLLRSLKVEATFVLLDFDRANPIVFLPGRTSGAVRINPVRFGEDGIWREIEIDLQNFYKKISAALKIFPEFYNVFYQNWELAPQKTGMVRVMEFSDLWRRRLEGGDNAYKVLCYTELLKKNMDLWQIILEKLRKYARDFVGIFNQLILSYRKTHKVRGENPFPLLKIEQGYAEIPLWYIADSQRWRVYVKNADFYVREYESLSWRRIGINENLYPRGPLVTLFLRRQPFDVFVHGRSGYIYDMITEELALKFFDQRLIPKLGLSASLPLWTKIPNFSSLERDELHIKQFLKVGAIKENRKLKEMLERKKYLAQCLASAEKEQKKEFYKRIKDLEQKIEEVKRREYADMYARLNEVQTILSQKNVYLFREWPFFLYSRSRIRTFFESAFNEFKS